MVATISQLFPRSWFLLFSVLGACVVFAPPASAQQSYYSSEASRSVTTAAAPGASFTETFDGEPEVPEPFVSENWDIALFTRDVYSWYEPSPGKFADHGPSCEPPPQQHLITSFDDVVYRCKDHIMTAINDTGFGRVTLTPAQMVDFSAAEATIEFDLSTFRRGGYDWLEFFISPFAENLVHPTHAFWDIAGPARNGILISMVPGGTNVFKMTVFKNGVETHYEFCGELCTGVDAWTAYGTSALPLVPSQKRRETFRISLSQESISFGVVGYTDSNGEVKDFLWLDDVALPEMEWDQGVVQLSHSSFNPTNNCLNILTITNPPDNPAGFEHQCEGDTWHWDNVIISPATPFTIIPTAKLHPGDTRGQRFVDPSVGVDQSVIFAHPAPADSFLRFSAIGDGIEVSVDDGKTWEAARLQPQLQFQDFRFNNYFHPIPAGVDTVRFRGGEWWGGQWHARDLSIWSLNTL